MSGPGGGDALGLAEMAESSHIDSLPEELLMEILSLLTWRKQLQVRSVSRRWQAAVDACLARRQELHVRIEGHNPGILDKMVNLLQKTPSLRRLGLRLEGDKHLPTECMHAESDVGPILDPSTMVMMCSSCPLIEEVHLSCCLYEDVLRTLLSCLPGLRVLHPLAFRVCGDVLSLLPTGLQSLCLRESYDPEPALFRLLRRCPQLRELGLCEVTVEGLKEALAACPQLERLSVVSLPPDSDWCSVLALCPELQELRVVAHGHLSVNIFTVLTACGRMERLYLQNCSISLRPRARLSMGGPYKFGLSQLNLRNFKMDDTTFLCLARLLPGLTVLSLDDDQLLTEEGLGGLQCLTNLQVLELGCRLPLSTAGRVLDSLSELPLKAFSCSWFYDQYASGAPFMAALLRRCPTITVLRLSPILRSSPQRSLFRPPSTNPPDRGPDFLIPTFLDELGSEPLERDITLFLHRIAPSDIARLPGNICVVEAWSFDVWTELVGRCPSGWEFCRYCWDLHLSTPLPIIRCPDTLDSWRGHW